MQALERVGDNLHRQVAPDGATEAEIQDMNKLALSILACGYLCRVYTDARRPVFMPLWNYAFNQGGPDPDYVYSTAEIDSAGRLPDLRLPRHVPLRRDHPADFDMLSPAIMGGGTDRQPSPTTSTTSTIDDDGYFSVVLSAERPPGHDGDWWELDPDRPAPDARVLVRLEARDRRPGRDRAARRRRCAT